MMIRRPIERVFDCVTGMAFIQQWIAPFRVEEFVMTTESQDRAIHHSVRIPEIRQVSQGALGVGTLFKQSNESRGHPLEATIEVTEYKRPTVFAVKITAEIGKSETKWVFKPASEGTMMTLMFDAKSRGWWIKLVMFFALIVTKNSRVGSPQYMQRLKNYIEDQC